MILRKHNPFTVKHIKIILIYGNGMLNCLCVQFPLHFKMNISFGVRGWYGAWFHLKLYFKNICAISTAISRFLLILEILKFPSRKMIKFSLFCFNFQLTSSCSFNGSSEKLVKCTFHRTPNPEALFFVYKKCHLHLNNCRQIKQNFIFEKLSNVSWCVTCVTQSNFKLHQKNTLFSFISSAAQYITWSKSFLPRYWWLKIVLLNE